MAEEIDLETSEPTERPGSVDDLRPKMQLLGRVTKIDLYGAFVDVGIGHDALLHISKLRRGPVNRVDEILSEGDEVTVYVDRVDPKSNRVSLTMIKPLDVTWNDLQAGQVYGGKITRVEQYGLFVDIGAERPGLVHISELGDETIRHPREVYTVDDEISVRVLDYDRKKRRIDLTLNTKTAETQADEQAEGSEAIPTAMEMALRQALKGSDSQLSAPAKQERRPSKSRLQRAQDDILARTLESRKS